MSNYEKLVLTARIETSLVVSFDTMQKPQLLDQRWRGWLGNCKKGVFTARIETSLMVGLDTLQKPQLLDQPLGYLLESRLPWGTISIQRKGGVDLMSSQAASLAERMEAVKSILPEELLHPAVFAALQISLAEDLNAAANPEGLAPDPASGDVTSIATLDSDSWLEGRITAKAEGVVAGLPVAQAAFFLVNPRIQFEPLTSDGQVIKPGAPLADICGPGIGLLAGERTALNFLGRLSGIATLTHRFVQAVAGTRTVILDTRKTAPGLRFLDKYAVRMGGGQNHRAGLYDMVLVKDNHIDSAGGLHLAVNRVRKAYGDLYLVEVEVKDLEELQVALSLPVDRIMLDNMDLETLGEAVEVTAGRIPLEASGNVTLETVRSIAETGVDYISSGALTHSAPALDVSLRLRSHS